MTPDTPSPIRLCTDADFEAIFAVINDGARAYQGVVPADRLGDPYMPRQELRHEIDAGVRFSGYDAGGELVGVMGIQDIGDVTLIRHAYVRTAHRRRGIGGALLKELRAQPRGPLLIGTWAAATWAVDFYRKHGFEATTPDETRRLLRRYWAVPDRQVETSVVLAESGWRGGA